MLGSFKNRTLPHSAHAIARGIAEQHWRPQHCKMIQRIRTSERFRIVESLPIWCQNAKNHRKHANTCGIKPKKNEWSTLSNASFLRSTTSGQQLHQSGCHDGLRLLRVMNHTHRGGFILLDTYQGLDLGMLWRFLATQNQAKQHTTHTIP